MTLGLEPVPVLLRNGHGIRPAGVRRTDNLRALDGEVLDIVQTNTRLEPNVAQHDALRAYCDPPHRGMVPGQRLVLLAQEQ